MKLFEPQHPIVRRYVNNIYVIDRSMDQKKYIAFPAPYLAVGLFRDAAVSCRANEIIIKKSDANNYTGIAVNLLIEPIKVCYESMPDEIAINFKPLGFTCFSGAKVEGGKSFSYISAWQDELPAVFDTVFKEEEPAKQQAIIEAFLAAQFTKFEKEAMLQKAIRALSEAGNEYTMQAIAEVVGMHYKELYRNFMQYIGCSPAHFRKIVRFRNSVEDKLKNKGKLTEICYNNNYTDQSYFIKEYQKLTGESPKDFFKNLSVVQDSNITWRFY